MENRVIADMLDEIASMLSIEETQSSRFEVRAYRKAALTVGTLQEQVEDIYRKEGTKGLMELPGIGKGIAGSIEEYIKTGHMKKYEMLKRKYPIDMKGLTNIEGLGAKRAVALYKELGVRSIADLKKVVEEHRISKLPGFGEKSESAIGKNIKLEEARKGRMLLGDAFPVAERIAGKLAGSKLVDTVMVAGSLRRMRETIGDIDILALADDSSKVMDFFSGLPEVSSVVAKGRTKTTVNLEIGLNCDLRVIAPESFGAALQYFTGSRDHNVQVRTIAVNKGYKLNEYGLFDSKGKIIPTKDESAIYERLGMQYMPPEMREARGEVKLAQVGKIPELVDLRDVRGDMHTHTNDTDGANSIEEMADAAINAGHEYFATTNHTKSLGIARGMDEKQFARFFRRVDKLNESLDGKITILKGAEVDILKDGRLDLSRECLESMDCVVAAIHSSFKMSEKEMTDRIIKALDTGLVDILAHPTGREINIREQYPLDIERVFEASERNGVALEINAFPNRLDLNDTNIMKASHYKVSFSLGTDAHRTSHLGFMKYGVGTARRGWLTKDRIISTLPLKRLMKELA
ncbi:MAG: DNA polymerase/3'-5' exonuclease PolX [Candidatus Micrarchaeota archaeon]|nr:DNA polymerase/3'-5' exonuclease PolX [Candidatus Micrarchaeota archaeon]